MEVAVGLQAQPRFRSMFGRRHARDHSDRGALAEQPVWSLRGIDVIALLQRLIDDVDTLVKTIAAVLQVFGLVAQRDKRIGRLDDVAPPELEWIHPDAAGELIDRGFDREDSLGKAVSAKSPRRKRVGIHRVRVDLLVRTAID